MVKKIANFLRWNSEQNILINLGRGAARLAALYLAVVVSLHAPFIAIGNLVIWSRDDITHEWVHHGETQEIIVLAKQGDPEAMEKLAILYDEGKGGISQNNCRALRWYDKAARKGQAISQLRLAVAYYFGDGLPISNELAYYWSKHANKDGMDLGRFNRWMEILEEILPAEIKYEWKSFEPAKQSPAQIYDGPYLANLEFIFFFSVTSCKEWAANISGAYP